MRRTNSGSFSLQTAFRLYPAFLIVMLFLCVGVAAYAQSTTTNIPAGTHPLAVAVNIVTNQVYVADQTSNDVTVIDGKTNLTTDIPVGSNPGGVAMTQPTAIAVNPATDRIYVVNQGTAAKQFTDGGVTVIDGTPNVATTNSVIATIAAGRNPVALAVNPLTNKIYVANFGSGLSTVTVIDGATNTTTSIAVQVSPVAIAINPSTNQIFVANRGSNSVSIIDGNTNSVTNVSVSPAVSPVAVAVNPILNHVYIATNFSSSVINPSVSVVDAVGKKVLKTVAVGNNPTALAVNPVTSLVYVSNQGDNTVTVIQDGASIDSNVLVPVGNHPYAVAVNPATNQIYVGNQGSNNLSVIDGATNTVTGTVTVGSLPNGVAVNPVTNTIYVANTGNDVTVVDGGTNLPSVDIAGVLPSAVAVNPVNDRAYVANRGNGTVTVIDEVTSVSTTVPVGVFPSAITVNPVTGTAYVANYGSFTVTAIDDANKATTFRVGPHPISLGVNPVTNMIYVANQGTTLRNFVDSSVTVVDGATNTTKNVPFGADQFVGGSLQLIALAVDPVFNQIYVVNEGTAAAAYADGSIFMLSGMDNATITQFFPAGTIQPVQPTSVAVSSVDGHIFVADFGSNDINAFDSFGTYLGDITTGTQPYALAVNPATNYIYAANFGSHNVTAINGNVDPTTGTNLFPTATINVGSNPGALAINPVLNKIYVAGSSSNAVTVIDGASGNSISTIATRTKPVSVAVNPTTGNVYVANNGSADVTVISEATPANPPIPLSIQVQGVSDSGTTSGLGVFATSNANPAFTAVVNSAFSPNAPAPTALYYQLDTAIGPWHTASSTGGAGANPANYSLALSSVLPGAHTLYLYAAYGDEGTPRSASNGTGNSPWLSSSQAFPFAIINPPTNTTIASSANPQNAGDPVTFTGCATPFAATGSFLGTMTFFDGGKILGQKIIDPNDPNGPNPCPTLTVYTLAKGIHTISAVYSGSTALTSSQASLVQQVNLVLGLSVALPTGGVTPVYGQVVRIAARVPLGGTVTFAVNGQAQTPVTVLGGSAFLTLNHLAAGTYAIDASFAGTGGQNLVATTLNLTVNPAPLTVTPASTFRFYGAANPLLHGTITGVLVGDGITATYTVPGVTTTTPVGNYPINVQLNDPNNKLSNYAVTVVPGTLSVFTAPLTLIALTESRPYGAPDNFKGTVIGALPGDKVGFVVTGTASVPQNAPVGTYKNAITPVLVDNNNPPKLSNYFINSVIKGEIIVGKALLTATADNQTRVYGAADPTFTVTLAGVPASVLASDGITASGTSTDTAASVVGSYPITPHVSDPNNRLSNYTLLSKSGFLTITPAPLTVTADNQTGAVGQPIPTLTGVITGALPADSITATYSTSATMSSPAGAYPIVPMVNANPKLSNYTVTLVNGTLTLQ